MLWCLLLSVAGIGLSSYLAFLHFGLMRGELLGGAICGGSGGPFNCHAVTAGSWGRFLGMPLALWGLLGYLTIFSLSLLGHQSAETAAQLSPIIFLLAIAFVGIDLLLLAVMAFIIRFYCLFCLLTYAVNLSLLCVSARSLAVPWPGAFGQLESALSALLPSKQRPAVDMFWGLMFVIVLGVVGLHTSTIYVSRGTLANVRTQLRDFIIKQPRVTSDTSGDPTIGPAGAPLKIVEFSDFFCPACQRASQMNTIILANHRNDALFVFKHFPLDTTCNDKVTRMVHPGACQVAAASECAHLQGKFWPFHDLVFQKGHTYNLANLEGDLSGLGVDLAAFRACMSSGKGMEAVKRDVAAGGEIGVQSTPTYVVNGVRAAGGFNPDVFDDFAAVVSETSHK